MPINAAQADGNLYSSWIFQLDSKYMVAAHKTIFYIPTMNIADGFGYGKSKAVAFSAGCWSKSLELLGIPAADSFDFKFLMLA